jgi:hypothetical protein
VHERDITINVMGYRSGDAESFGHWSLEAQSELTTEVDHMGVRESSGLVAAAMCKCSGADLFLGRWVWRMVRHTSGRCPRSRGTC